MLWWASTHRQHHRFTDASGDPHSPHQRGFWHSHIFWTISTENEGYDPTNVRDLTRYPELRLIERFSTVPLVAYIALTAVVGGFHGVGWWYCVPTVALMHAVMLINSVSHMVGRRRFGTRDQSRNNMWLALFTLGEGWHNNHHRYMASARQGFYWWEVDLTYYGLKALEWFGLVWSLRQPPREVLQEGRDGAEVTFRTRLDRTCRAQTRLSREPRPETLAVLLERLCGRALLASELEELFGIVCAYATPRHWRIAAIYPLQPGALQRYDRQSR